MGEIAPQEQFLPLSTIFYYLMLDFYVETGIRFSLRVKRLFEITEVEITRVNCIYYFSLHFSFGYLKPLVSQSKFSVTRKFTLIHQWFGMDLNFEM